MPEVNANRSRDLQGAGRLTVEAILGITDLVEAMHHTIASLGGLLSEEGQTRTGGITGLVYQSIRVVTSGVGRGLDLPLAGLGSRMEVGEAASGREAVLSAVNGVLGDHLVARANPLAIPMQLRRQGRPLSDKDLDERIAHSSGRVALFVHGSCMNDLQWSRGAHDHGAALEQDLGMVPLYLHYNTGLHTSENGRKLADLLESRLTRIPHPIRLYIIAHSMGGLVARSACHYGQKAGHSWLERLQGLVFLGTPHHGALLERGGNWLENILKISRYSAPFSRLGRIRSAGVTDLRFGNVVDEDWAGKDPYRISTDLRVPVPLPGEVSCYAMAATTRGEGRMGSDIVGDGLVTVDSALGRHRNPERQLRFPEAHQWVGRELSHLDLLNHPAAYATLKRWLTPPL